MTRTGKIARLPNRLREDVNRRLYDGHLGQDILHWLNAQPEVRDLVFDQFHGNFVTPSNLSEWKNGGYREWLVRQDTLDLVSDLQEKEALGDPALADAFTGDLLRWFILHYAAAAVRYFATPDLDAGGLISLMMAHRSGEFRPGAASPALARNRR